MNLIFEKQTYPSLQEFVALGLQDAAANKERLQFAHQIDGSILAALESLPAHVTIVSISLLLGEIFLRTAVKINR